MHKYLIFLLLAVRLQVAAREPRASLYEWRWALFHPVAAVKIKIITRHCAALCKQTQVYSNLDNFSNGGQADAFRHCFYMAAFAQKIGTRKLRTLGIAHEKANYRAFRRSETEEGELPDSLGSVMDLVNNELGFKIGNENKTMRLEELQQRCIEEIKAGKALIMKRDAFGKYLDCEGKELDMKLYYHRWNIPKCLVNSDQ